MRSLALALCLTLAAILLPACAASPRADLPRGLDAARAEAVLVATDDLLAAWQVALPDKADDLTDLRDALDTALVAVRLGDEIDVTTGVAGLLALADRVAIGWPDERQRAIGLTALQTLRLSLVLAGVELQEAAK